VADIFISYARDDDASPPGKPDKKGFVTYLYESVEYEFRDLGPDRPKIWRDVKRISEAAQFTDELEKGLKEASILLVVLSPNWMASKWCNRELETFARYHGPDGIRQRIVVVSKHHIDFDARPELLQGQTGFEFYVRNKDPDDIAGDTEFFDRGEVRDDRYWQKLNALVAHLLKRKPPPPPPPPYPPSGRTIFVAKPASDMQADYDRIVSELVGRGHKVVPPPMEEVPLNEAIKIIDDALSSAEISIHLLGEKAGPAPEDQSPMVKLQLERAAGRVPEALGKDEAGKFRRLVWAPALWSVQAVAGQPAQQIKRHPVDVLTRFDRQLPSDKVEGDSPSKFVDFINQYLAANAPRRSTWAPDKNGALSLYLYHSPEDSEYAFNLAQALQQQRQLDALLPVFDGPEAEIKSFNGKQLAECDAVVLCWAGASEVWVRAQASGLRNWQDLGRKQQFSYRAVIAAPPPGNRKKFAQRLFPSSDIDLVVDLSDKPPIPTAELLDILVPAAHAAGP